MSEQKFDPEDTQWMRRAHGTLAPRTGDKLVFSLGRLFRLTGFEVEKGEGLTITNIQVGCQRQMIPKALVPLHTFHGILTEVCFVGQNVEVRFFNQTSAPIEYDFRAVGWELCP